MIAQGGRKVIYNRAQCPSQSGGEFSYSSCCNQAEVSSSHTLRQNRLCRPRLSPLHSLLAFGRSGLRPSLVRGDSPRNAPLRMPDPRGQFERLRQRPVFEPPTAPVGAGLVPALCPLTDRPPANARLGACPAPLQEPVNSSSHRRHDLPARLFPPQI